MPILAHIARLPNVLSKATMALAAVFFVVLVVLGVLMQVYIPDWLSLTPLWIGLICMSFMGGVNLFASRRDGRKVRLIVCEAGVLMVRKISWGYRVQVISWKDIQIQQSPFKRDAWRIIHCGQAPLGVFAAAISAADYQDGDELIAFIRERTAEVTS